MFVKIFDSLFVVIRFPFPCTVAAASLKDTPVVGSVFRHPSVEGFFANFGRAAAADRRAPV